jgi:hypothetical protein
MSDYSFTFGVFKFVGWCQALYNMPFENLNKKRHMIIILVGPVELHGCIIHEFQDALSITYFGEPLNARILILGLQDTSPESFLSR